MKQLPTRLYLILSALLFVACEKQGQWMTTVEGTVLNKYTGQPVAAVPVVVRRHRAFLFSGESIDSLTAAETDAAGHYSLSFEAAKAGSYRVIIVQQNLYDVENGFDGYAEAERGTANHLDFAVTPYKTVTLDVDTNKGGKTDITFGYVTWDPGNWVGGTIFYDTLKAHQGFHFLQTIQVVPNRAYRFNKTTANRYKVPNTYYYDFRDYTSTFVERAVGYNDTTVIKFR
ncbi:hypothetical protein [Hymenobacter crusticola]|nr:hypothetical protein [Hymenobacter crusticola]